MASNPHLPGSHPPATARLPNWELLIDRLPDPVACLDSHLRFLYVNRQWRKQFGSPDEETLGKTFRDLSLPVAFCEAMQSGFEEAIKTKSIHEFRCPYFDRTGLEQFSIQLQPEVNTEGEVSSVLAVFRKSTDQLHLDAEAVPGEIWFNAFMAHSPGVAWIKDASGRYVYLSPNHERVFGQHVADWSGKTDAELWPPEIARSYRERDLEVLTSGVTQEYFDEICYSDGSASYWLFYRFLVPEKSGKNYVGGTAIDITERRYAELNLQESESWLRTILEAGAFVVLGITPEFFIFEWNRAAERIYGWSRSEVLGINYLTNFLPEEARAGVEDEIRNVLEGTPTIAYLNDVVHRDGSRRTILWNACRVLDGRQQVRGLLAIGQDITDLKRAENLVRQSEARYRQLVENIHDVVWSIEVGDDPYHGKLIFVSPQAKALAGFAAEEFLGSAQLWANQLHPDDWPVIRDSMQRLIHGGEPVSRVYRFRHGLTGEYRWLEDRVAALKDTSGKLTGLFGVIRDITDRKQAEEERRRLQIQLQHTQKLESLGILAGGIAHDFNNILTSIMGFTDMATTLLPHGSVARSHLDRVMTSSRRAAELTQQMLAYSGRGQFVIEAVNLSHVVQDLRPLLTMSISKKAKVHYQLQPHLPEIRADASQLRQIIMNLIINASDSLEDRPGEITVTTRVKHCEREELSLTFLDEQRPPGRYVLLEVRDSGVGMDSETRARIFDPFFTTKSAGRGLGLAAVLGIIRGHQGAIRVESEPGRGSTFCVMLPVEERLLTSGESPEPEAAAMALCGTILVVDDEASVRELAEVMLAQAGFRVLTACDGHEAMEILRTTQSDISLVLLDLTMPLMSGEETHKEIRKLYPQLRVILSSGYNEFSASPSLLSQGNTSFLQKPYRYHELLTTITKVMS